MKHRANDGASLTKANVVYADLRERMLRGSVAPGTRLVIRRVAEKYGVSDIPVREAFRLLEKDGLIKYLPYGGAFVKGMSDAEVYELFFIRGLLEAAATQLSVSFMNEITLRKLDRLCREMEECTRARDADRYGALNHEFHRTIFTTVPASNLVGRIEDLWQSHAWSRTTFRLQASRMAASNLEHRRIVKALRERSSGEAARVAFEHKQNARRAFVAARNKHEARKDEGNVESESIIEAIDLLSGMWGGMQWASSSHQPEVGHSQKRTATSRKQ